MTEAFAVQHGLDRSAMVMHLTEAAGRTTVTIRCVSCAWAAQMTADDYLEVARFLGARFKAHVLVRHPEQLPADPEA